jgi:hypothetical protein
MADQQTAVENEGLLRRPRSLAALELLDALP